MTNAAVGSSTHTSVIFTAGSPNCHSFSRTLRPICHPFSRSSPYCHPERSEGSLFLCTRDSSSLALLRMTKKGAPRDDKRMVLHTTTRMMLHTTTKKVLLRMTKKRCISERQKSWCSSEWQRMARRGMTSKSRRVQAEPGCRFLLHQKRQTIAVSAGHHLFPHGRTAVNARVVVSIPFGQDEEQPFPHRDGLPAVGAEKFRRVEISVGSVCHLQSPSGISFRFSSQTLASPSLGAR